MTLVYVAGDTGPDLPLEVRRLGAPVNLTGRTVTARVEREASSILIKDVAVTAAAAGRVVVHWLPGELVAPGPDRARYVLTLRVEDAGGQVVTHDASPLEFRVRPLDYGLIDLAPPPGPSVAAALAAAIAALAFGNIDGGYPDSNYGGLAAIDAGGPA